jgi:hypothetical protein
MFSAPAFSRVDLRVLDPRVSDIALLPDPLAALPLPFRAAFDPLGN